MAARREIDALLEHFMPNEPVQCPNCGSGDVSQLAADSYECEHCHTNFRWVNPTKSTVAHEQKLCACGRVPIAFCIRCRKPLCPKHKITWPEGDVGEELGDDTLDLYAEYLQIAPDHPERILKEIGLPVPEDMATLCKECWFECMTTYVKAISKACADQELKATQESPSDREELPQEEDDDEDDDLRRGE